jgi:hypothetical protein
MPKNYPRWNDDITPHTDPLAKVTLRRNVYDVRVIKVELAIHRKAILSDMFELEEQNDDPILIKPSGKRKVKVVCAWYGVKPPTAYPELDISKADYKIIENYTGLVADNISR